MHAGLLSSIKTITPKLSLRGRSINLHLDFADISSSPGAICLAVEARGDTGLIIGPDSMDALVPALNAQDVDGGFKVGRTCMPMCRKTRVNSSRERVVNPVARFAGCARCGT